ncbi:MAG: hypothetical protein PF690_18335, partial [Deltaproteobacteria bacterium]|nr:hypothetical protein [Deltaproteobacteria bacterium]
MNSSIIAGPIAGRYQRVISEAAMRIIRIPLRGSGREILLILFSWKEVIVIYLSFVKFSFKIVSYFVIIQHLFLELLRFLKKVSLFLQSENYSFKNSGSLPSN